MNELGMTKGGGSSKHEGGVMKEGGKEEAESMRRHIAKQLEDGEWGWAGGMASRASLRNKIFPTYTCAH